jgi:hypothetical protein
MARFFFQYPPLPCEHSSSSSSCSNSSSSFVSQNVLGTFFFFGAPFSFHSLFSACICAPLLIFCWQDHCKMAATKKSVFVVDDDDDVVEIRPQPKRVAPSPSVVPSKVAKSTQPTTTTTTTTTEAKRVIGSSTISISASSTTPTPTPTRGGGPLVQSHPLVEGLYYFSDFITGSWCLLSLSLSLSLLSLSLSLYDGSEHHFHG